MSAISGFINTIRNAVYGEQVRGAIVSALEQCYSDVNSPSLQTAAFTAALNAAYAGGILDIQTVTQISSMTNQNIIYRYNGTQAGYQKGLYYYSPLSSAWVLIGSEIHSVSNSSQMTDTNSIYKYTGTQSGMVQNALYCHNGTSWIPIGSGVLTSSTIAGMTNTGAIYKYTGTQSGMIQNALYYHNGTSWIPVDAPIETDATLAIQGKPADAKAVGDAIDSLSEDITGLEEQVESDISDLEEQMDSIGLNDGAIYLFTTLLENALYKKDMSAEVEQLGDALRNVDGIEKNGTTLTINYLIKDTATANNGYLSIT